MSVRRGLESGTSAAIAWFVALGVVVLGPLLAPGYLLLLDLPAGPNPPWPSLAPLPSDGLVNASAPFAFLMRTFGSLSPQLINKVLVFIVIAVGGLGVYRFLVGVLRLSRLVALVAGTFFVINPFVYERMVSGQVFFALGCALLPWALPSLAETCTSERVHPALKAIAWTAAISLVDIHVGGMAAVLLVLAICLSPRPWKVRLALTGVGLATLLAVNLFWILPSFLAAEGARLGAGDLLSYAPRPRSAAILPRVLMLHGFWRIEFTTPLKSNPALFMIAFAPLFVLALVGAVRAMRFDTWRRSAAALGVAALVGIVLGMGTSFPPTGRVTEFLYDNIPGYGIYREPQKWIALLVLAYAVFAGVGLQSVADRFKRNPSVVLAVLGLPLLATPMAMWGFGGQADVSEFPQDWARAEQLLEKRDGNLLFLPWNLYQPVEFAGNRTIANPGNYYFGPRTLISGDAALGRADTTAPADPRDEFVYRLVIRGDELNSFGHLVAPLGVRFVALAHIADAPDYGWLKRQSDLRPILEGNDLSLYENTVWRGSVFGLQDEQGDPASGDVLGTPTAERSVATQVHVSNENSKEPLGGPAFVRSSPGWKEIRSPAAPIVGTDRSCSDGWRLGDERPVCHLGALAAFETPSTEKARLWRPGVFFQIVGWLLSLMGVVCLLWSMRRGHRREGAS